MLTWHLALARGKRDKTFKDFAEPKPRLAFRKGGHYDITYNEVTDNDVTYNYTAMLTNYSITH